MTRQDFRDDVTWWPDLIEVCQENGCDVCDDVYSAEDMDVSLCDSIREDLEHNMWHSVKEKLEYIDWEGDEVYYRRDGEWDWKALDDDDFYSYKDAVEEWMDDNGYFDDDDDEEDEDEVESEFPEYPAPPKPAEVEEPEIEPEPIGIAELFTISNSQLQTLKWEPEEKEPIGLPF